jgi:hypothetical protein
MNRDTRPWYARWASPRLRGAFASVGGMPVTPKIELMMISWPSKATTP